MFLFFFFQAEDGIRDADVTGVQTCALPISGRRARRRVRAVPPPAASGVTWGRIGVVALGLLLVSDTSGAAEKPSISWHPSKPRLGDVAWLHVQNVVELATVEGSVDGRPLTFFPYAGGHAALLGIDLEVKPGAHAWRVGVVEQGREPWSAQGKLLVAWRNFPLERLTLPQTMVDLDSETERRAVAEGTRLAILYRTITPERLWRGQFTKPVGTPADGTGFRARRIINGQVRSPHGGIDYSVPQG